MAVPCGSIPDNNLTLSFLYTIPQCPLPPAYTFVAFLLALNRALTPTVSSV